MYIKYVDKQGNESLQEVNISAVKTDIWGDDGKEDFYEVYNHNFQLAMGLCDIISSIQTSDECDICIDGIADTAISFCGNCGLFPRAKDAFMAALVEALNNGTKVFDVSAWYSAYKDAVEIDKGV